MSMASVFQIIDDNNRRVIQHHTFGHLFPDGEKTFRGHLIVSETDYGDIVVIKDNSGVESSPWWFASMNKFVDEFLDKHGKIGVIFKVHICCKVVSDKKDGGSYIEIKKLGHRRINIGG